MRRPRQQPDANPRYASGRHQDEGGGNPADHDDVVCRDPEIDVGIRAAGNDLRMSVDDEVIPVEEAGYARRKAEQRSQHQPLAYPSPPDRLALRRSIRFDGAYHAQHLRTGLLEVVVEVIQSPS